MKIGLIVVTAGEPIELVDALKVQFKKAFSGTNYFYHIKNIKGKEGYAQGVNKGLRKGSKDNIDLFIVANPDISLPSLSKKKIEEAAKHFDIWGYSMKQGNTIYYGGEIDKWRMSGGLIARKPRSRFAPRDFVSGSLICIKKNVVEKVGFWDEDYFLYYDEVDYCHRAKRDGFKIGLDSSLSYRHVELSKDNNPLKDYYLKKNRTKFLMKYGTFTQKAREMVRLPKTILENREGFLFNFFSLNASSLANKGLAFLLFLFLIKVFSPKEYGVYTLIWTQLSLLAPFSDLGTTNYGILESKFSLNDKFNSLFSLRTAVALVVWILTILLAFTFHFDKNILLFLLLASPVLISNAFSGSLLILTSLKQKVYLTSVLSVGFNLILTAALIAVVSIYHSLLNVFIITGIFYLLYAVINIAVLKKFVSHLRFTFDFINWAKILRSSFIFVLISFFASLYFKLDIFLLNFMKGTDAVGIYSAGYKFFEALLFISASYNIISIPIFTQLYKGNREFFFKRLKKDFLLIFFFSMLGAITLSMLAPLVFQYFLKGTFTPSISVFQIVIYAFPPLILSSLMYNALYIFKKAHVVLYLFIFQAALNVILNLIFIPHFSYIASSYITVYCELINFMIATFCVKYFFTHHENNR